MSRENLRKNGKGSIAVIRFKHIYHVIGKKGFFSLRKGEAAKA